MIIDPTRKYQIAGQVYPLLSVYFEPTVANNQQALANASGYKYRFMGGWAASAGAGVSVITFKDGTGGTNLLGMQPAGNAVGIDFLPIIESGYAETTTGNGLFADVSTTAARVTVFYIKYKP